MRLVWIDAVRGFAVFGIFIVNIGAFSAPFFLRGGAESVWNSDLDQASSTFIDMFFQASFYPLFSILFGFGIQMLKDRLEQRNIDVVRFLSRRLLILIGFGIFHAFVIWHGDILLSYGIIGLLSLTLLRVKDRTLLVWAFSLLGGSTALLTLALFAVRDYLGGYDQASISQAMESYQSSSLLTIWSQNYQDWLSANGGILFVFLTVTLLPLFLIGMYIARKHWLHNPDKYIVVLRRLWIVSFVGFIGLKVGPYLFGNPLWFSYIQDNIGGTLSAIFYIVSVTLLAKSKLGLIFIQPFAAVGRMALTNYLAQSILSFFLFYGIGFGLYGSIRPLEGIGIVLLVFSIQVILSNWWFKKFRFGPFEWLWRSLTYKQWQPFLKRPSE